MPVPKRRTSSTRRDKRRTHDALTAPAYSTCSNCGEPMKPHNVCKSCGFYKGKQIIELKSDK
ncbi:MAG: 50S ribosomal protein L32 [Candidatus Zophobacter franzmannii]|nr:50S ribosomal protein L32 [Candidatus Zophobacter franzmannii]